MEEHLRLPGEFEAHKGTYILWPERPDNWRDNATRAQRDIIYLANIIAKYEPVTLGYSSMKPNPSYFHKNVLFICSKFSFHPWEISFYFIQTLSF